MSLELTPEQSRQIRKNLRKVPIRAINWEPTQTASGSWRLNVPSTVSPTGKRQQLFFPTEEAARDEASRLRDTRRTFGELLTDIDPHELSEAVQALKLLRPHGVGLLECVRSWISDRKRREQSRTLCDAFDAYERTGSHWSRDYAKDVGWTRDAVHGLLGRSLDDITAADLERSLTDCAASTRDARIRRLRSIYNEAIRQGWCVVNVAGRMNLSKARRDEVRIYSVDVVEDLLLRALATDPAIVPFWALCAFCGLRPEREAAHLYWNDVHLDDAHPQVVVRPELSKVRRRRIVDISPNCVEWLKASGVERVGRVMPWSESTLKRCRHKLCGSDPGRGWEAIEWIQDGFRHTFASAHLAKHGDINKTVIQLGHFGNPSMLWSAYHRTMTKSDSEAFWAIVPPQS